MGVVGETFIAADQFTNVMQIHFLLVHNIEKMRIFDKDLLCIIFLIKVSSFQTEYMVKMSLTVLKKKKG
jgi:hypothetical protein